MTTILFTITCLKQNTYMCEHNGVNIFLANGSKLNRWEILLYQMLLVNIFLEFYVSYSTRY
jgi:hypothetical protein